MGFRCNLGMHQGAWEYDYSRACDQSRRCTSCGTVSSRVRHTFGDWRFTDDGAAPDCSSARTCARCDATETDYRHEFHWVNYREVLESMAGKPGSGLLGIAGAMASAYTAANVHPCSQIMACRRCGSLGDSNTRITEHDWGRWQTEGYGGRALRICGRCGEREARD
jgi:hypothetical protein